MTTTILPQKEMMPGIISKVLRHSLTESIEILYSERSEEVYDGYEVENSFRVTTELHRSYRRARDGCVKTAI